MRLHVLRQSSRRNALYSSYIIVILHGQRRSAILVLLGAKHSEMNNKMSDTQRSKTEAFVSRYWDEEAELPKHEKLRQAFSTSISEGYWSAGMHLPTEADLVRNTPCSLGTVQRALRDLAAEGLIERRRGSGSVVADLMGKLNDPWHIRYVDPTTGGDGYYSLRTTMVKREKLAETGPWSTVLRQGDELVTKIERIFIVDERIRIYSEFYTLSSLFPEFMNLPETELNGLNFKRLISQRYRVPTHKVHQSLRFVKTPPNVATQCGTPTGSMSPLLNVVAYPPDGDPIYYQDFFLPVIEERLDLGFAVRHV